MSDCIDVVFVLTEKVRNGKTPFIIEVDIDAKYAQSASNIGVLTLPELHFSGWLSMLLHIVKIVILWRLYLYTGELMQF